MAQFYSIGHYQFSPEDRLLFDTNIWISLFDCRSNPPASLQDSKIYTGALKRATKAESQLFTHPIIIGEFINRMIRDEHNFLVEIGEADRNFKTWRRTPEYLNFAEVVAANVRAFGQQCTLLEHGISKDSVENCLSAFETNACDFNDEMLLALCKDNDLKLVTHDGDFQHASIQILTANARYLRS